MKARSVPFDALKVGDESSFIREVTEGDVRAFAQLSGDTNPVHLDEDYAAQTPFKGRIVHGTILNAHVSAALATKLPGPGTIYLEASLRFRKPARIGDVLSTHLQVTEKIEDKKFVRLSVEVRNQDHIVLATGLALVIPPPKSEEIVLADRP